MTRSSAAPAQEWVEQRLAAVLEKAARAETANRPYFLSEERLRDAGSVDRVLYRASRDVEPPFDDVERHCTWRIDQLEIAADDLASGELNRSVGHWNPDDQIEVFQVDRGSVVMVVAAAGDPTVSVISCRAGALVALRPGSWHLTYAVEGHAAVTNIYSQSAARHTEKYFTRRPLQVGLRRGAHGVEVVVPQSARATRVVLSFEEAPVTDDVAAGLGNLRDLFRTDDGRRERLADLLALL